ncbi:MAG: hypothetical protein AB8B60_13905 [Sulfitobacter sp.]
MAASYEILSEWNLKYVFISSSIELDELRSLADRYFDDPRFDRSIRFLVDLTELTASSARFRDVFTLYSYYRRKLHGLDRPIDVAIVAPGDFAFGMSHMFFALANMDHVMHIKIFADMAGAAEWLVVPVEVATHLHVEQYALLGAIPQDT